MAAALATVADVRARPEFSTANATGLTDAAIQSALDQAERATPEGVWDEQRFEAHLTLACHIIAMGPFGRDMRLKSEEGKTLYLVERERLELARYAQTNPRTS